MLVLQYQTDPCKNVENKREPTVSNIPKLIYFLEIKTIGKSREYPTIGGRFGFDNLLQIIIVDFTNQKIHTTMIPFATTTLILKSVLSELENTVSALIANGTINEKYVVDLFTQEALFEDKRKELESKYQGKEIVVCGGEIFTGDDVDKLIEKSSVKYPKRPFYSHSFKKEYSTF